jgi:hypothetical protein
MSDHGNHAAWNRHQKAGEPQCEDCLEWQRRYNRDRRIRKASGCAHAFPLELVALPIDGLGPAIARSLRESA